MIKRLKLGLQMLRYTFGIKTCAIMGIFFLAIGILMELLPQPVNSSGTLFISLTGMWTIQLTYSLGVSNLVRSSKWAKAMETSIPALVGFVSFFVTYLLVLCLNLPYLSTADEETMQIMAGEMILSGILALVLMVYCGVAYKLFIVGTVLFLAVIFCGNFNAPFMLMESLNIPVSFGTAVAIGFLEILVGALLQYGVSCLLHKVPLSKKAQMRGLQKLM